MKINMEQIEREKMKEEIKQEMEIEQKKKLKKLSFIPGVIAGYLLFNAFPGGSQ